MKTNKYIFIFYITSIILLLYSGYLIVDWILENKSNDNVIEHTVSITNIVEEKEKDKYPYIKTDFKKLLKENNKTVGWIQVPNTNINYPVLQTTDNDFYLTHNFNDQDNSAGWVFMDYRNDSKNLDTNTLLYAHNRLDESMFGTLKNTLYEEWYKNNNYIYYNTLDTMNTYEVFSVYTINVNDFINAINFKSDEDFKNYLTTIYDKSDINKEIDLSSTEKIITLYTCSGYNNERTILHAKLVQTKKA